MHKTIAASAKLFLDELNFKSVWNLTADINFVELVVLKDKRQKLLKAIKHEIDTTGFIPMQYAMEFESKGEVIKGVKNEETGVSIIEFNGIVKEIRSFKNISGDFHLIRYEDEEGNNYLNKRYKLDKEILMTPVRIRCRPVATLQGLNGEVINLINYARAKEL